MNQKLEKFDEKKVFKKCLKFLYRTHKKYINIDNYVEAMGKIGNTNMMSLFDCCREILPTKGKNDGLENS